MKTCPYCLAGVPDAAVKCQHCGEWLEQPPLAYETPALAANDPRRRPTPKLILFALALGIALAMPLVATVLMRVRATPAPMLRTATPVPPPALPAALPSFPTTSAAS